MRSTVTACHRLDLHTRTLFSCYLLRVSTKTQPFSGNPSSITYLIRTLFATPYLRSSAVLSGHAAYIGNQRRFGTNYRSRLQGVNWKMGPISCTETSVRNCRYSLRNGPEGHSYRLQFKSKTYVSSHQYDINSALSRPVLSTSTHSVFTFLLTHFFQILRL